MTLNIYNETLKEQVLENRIDSLENRIYITETYQNENEWYRLYSDGWIEQGGGLCNPNGGWVTVTLLKPMAYTTDKQYNIVVHHCCTYTSASSTSHAYANEKGGVVNVESITSTSFQYYAQTSGSTFFVFWEVQGYTA